MIANNYDDSTCQKALTFPLQFCWRARCRALVHFGGIAALFVALLLSAIPIPALAVDATWLDAPASADWNLGSNWSGGIAPVNSGDTATFGASTQTSPTLSGNVTIASVTFSPGASAFSIQVGAFPVTLRLQGDGIINDSGNVQTIDNSAVSSAVSFLGTSTAADATINNSGTSSDANFFDTSTAANATINNSAVFSRVSFLGTSTAANATITNSAAQSSANFFGTSTAANATINNSAALSDASFFGTSTAANATINNSAASSSAEFFNASTAANATINNSGAISFAQFSQTSSAGNARINNSGVNSFAAFFGAHRPLPMRPSPTADRTALHNS